MLDSRLVAGDPTIVATADDAGRSAGAAAADTIVAAIQARGHARVIFASAPSQETMLRALRDDDRIDWARVRSFHMDEYLGLAKSSPQSFGHWLQERLPREALSGFERIRPSEARELERYSGLLDQARIDLTCLGFGVNGHIAFNEPEMTAFDDTELIRRVLVNEVSRQQQVDDGLFDTLDDVPRYALSLTVPALMGARTVVATVLGNHKAGAVRDALSGPVTTACPASVLRTHPKCSVHLDAPAASLLP